MSTNLQSILKLEVPVIVRIATRQMLLEEVRGLVPGAIIELPKDTEDDLDILVNHQVIAGGRAVKVGENFGVRVTCVGRLTDRINAMGRPGPGSTPEPMTDEAAPSEPATEDVTPASEAESPAA